MNRSCYALCTLLVALAGSLFAGDAARGEDGANGAHICPLAENQCHDYANRLYDDCHWYDPVEDVPEPPLVSEESATEATASDEPAYGDDYYYGGNWYEDDSITPDSEPSDVGVAKEDRESSYDFHSDYDEAYDAEVYGDEPSIEPAAKVVADEAPIAEETDDPLVPPAVVDNVYDGYESDADEYGDDWYADEYQADESEAVEEAVDDESEYDEYWADDTDSPATPVDESQDSDSDEYDYENEIAGDNSEQDVSEAEAIEDESLTEDYWGESDQNEEVDADIDVDSAQSEPAKVVDEYDYDDYYDGDYDGYEYGDVESADVDSTDESAAEDADVEDAEADDDVDARYNSVDDDYYNDYEYGDVESADDSAAEEADVEDAEAIDDESWYDEYNEFDAYGDVEDASDATETAPQASPEEDYWGESVEDESPVIEPEDAEADDSVAIPAMASGKQALLLIAKVLDEIGTSLQATSIRIVDLVEEPVDVSQKVGDGDKR